MPSPAGRPHWFAMLMAGAFPLVFTGIGTLLMFDPADPHRALLDRSIGGGTWAMAAGGIVMLALGFMMCVGFVRAVRKGE